MEAVVVIYILIIHAMLQYWIDHGLRITKKWNQGMS